MQDGGWKAAELYAPAPVEGKLCTVILRQTDPSGIAQKLGPSLARQGARNIEIRVKGRTTTVSAVIRGQQAIVTAAPLASPGTGGTNGRVLPATLLSVASHSEGGS